MRSPTAAGGLVPTGETSTAMETTVNKPLLQFYSTEEENSKKKKLRTSIQYASYDSNVFQESNPPAAAPYCLRVVETKFRQNKTFDPGGSQGRLRACPFSGSWRALVCGKVIRAGAGFWRIDDSRLENLQESRTSKLLCRTYSVFFGGDSLTL